MTEMQTNDLMPASPENSPQSSDKMTRRTADPAIQRRMIICAKQNQISGSRQRPSGTKFDSPGLSEQKITPREKSVFKKQKGKRQFSDLLGFVWMTPLSLLLLLLFGKCLTFSFKFVQFFLVLCLILTENRCHQYYLKVRI